MRSGGALARGGPGEVGVKVGEEVTVGVEVGVEVAEDAAVGVGGAAVGVGVAVGGKGVKVGGMSVAKGVAVVTGFRVERPGFPATCACGSR